VKQRTVLVPLCLIVSLITSMLFFYSPCDPLYLQDRSINSLSFEEDLVIFSGSQKGLQTVLNKLDNYCSKWQLTTIKKQKNHRLSEE
jgi:hypothetical protein